MRELTNLVEMVEASVETHADRPLFGERQGGQWRWMTYRQWVGHVDAIRGGLARLGIDVGDRVAIISRNSAAWASAAYATYGRGAAFIPMYEAQRTADWELILRDCGASVVFVRTPAMAAEIEHMRPGLPALRHVITIEADVADPTSLSALEAGGRSHPAPAQHPTGDTVAGLIYTSGTTGIPKGAMLTHRNLTSNIAATMAAFPLAPTDRTLSFLPWAHVYGQACELHMLISVGGSTAFNTNIEHLVDDLQSVKPTLLVAVPRVFNKIHANLRAKMDHSPRLVRSLFWSGIAASIRRRRGEKLAGRERVLLWFAGILFAAFRRKLGGRLRYAISASATLSPEVGQVIDALGIEVYEGYGLTETSPVITTNRPGRRKLGSVGLPIEGVRVVIDTSRGTSAGEGEIVVYGPNVMRGYHARPEENARTFTEDGGLRTGDLGRIDEDGYLFITGRIKEQYKLQNGKYVMPSVLEEQLALSPLIQSVMLYGADRPYNVAVVVIQPDAVRTWAHDAGIELSHPLTLDPQAHDRIQQELEHLSRDFRPYERPRDCLLTEVPFTVENGLLTPTLKLKRREVVARYGPSLDALYGNADALPPNLTREASRGTHRPPP